MNDKNTETIGTRIAELRKSKGYSQEYIAEQLGVSRQAVSKWEQDLSAPDTYNLIALSKLLGVTVEYIAVGEIKSEPAADEQTSRQDIPAQALHDGGREWERRSIRRGMGFTLIAVGLVGMLGSLFLHYVLIITMAIVVLSGVLCLTVRKHLGIVLLWLYSTVPMYLFPILFGSIGPFSIFYPYFYIYAHPLRIPLAWSMWILPILATIFTVRAILKWRKSKKIKLFEATAGSEAPPL